MPLRLCLLVLCAAFVGRTAFAETPPAIVFDPAGLSMDEQYAVDALEGLANRDGPNLFQTRYQWDHNWIDVYTQRNSLHFTPLKGFDQLLQIFHSRIKGLVVYDPNIDGSRCVAMTLAGIDDLLPVDSEMLQGQSPGLKDSGKTLSQILNVPIQIDLRGKFKNSIEAYEWALKEVMPRCNRRVAHTPSGPDVDGVHVGMGPFRGFDWVIGQRGFIFNLALEYKDTKSFGGIAQGNAQQADEYRKILAALDKPALIYGYGEFEWDWFSLLGQYGHYYLHWGDNLSFHEKVPFTGKLVQKDKPNPADVTIERDKYYVCFITSEGDSMKGPEPFYYGSWQDPKRGDVPMNWTMPPLMARFPAMLSYYYDNATPNDCFIAYDIVNLAHMPNLADYSRLRAAEMQAADLHIVALSSRAAGGDGLKTYIEGVSPDGVAIIEWQKPHAPAKLDFIDGIPVSTSADVLGYWQNKIFGWTKDWSKICTQPSGMNDAVTKVVANIEKSAAPHPTPFVILVYADIHGYHELVQLHRAIADALDPKRFEVTRLDEALMAMRKWHATAKTQQDQ